MTTTTTQIRPRATGLPLQLLGRWGVGAVWARRLTDNALRRYSHDQLIHEGGANPLLLEIGALPSLKPKGAERLLAKAIEADAPKLTPAEDDQAQAMNDLRP